MADTTYNTEVFRERDTGKIRVQGAQKIAPLDSGDGLPEAIAKINDILALLTAAGINPEN